MALKGTQTFHHVVNGITYNFTVDGDTPLTTLQECFIQWIKDTANIKDKIDAQMASQAKEEPKQAEETWLEESSTEK